jgi:hypothetical protein
MNRGHHAKKALIEARKRDRRERKRARRKRRVVADVILTPEGMPAPAPTPGEVTIM